MILPGLALFMFEYPDAKQVIRNTLLIAILKMMAHLIVPFIFALLLEPLPDWMRRRATSTKKRANGI